MADIRPIESESSDSELSEGWDVVAQIDVCAADVSSDGESVEILEHEEADSSHPEDGDIIQSENSNDASNIEDCEPFEELPLMFSDEFLFGEEHFTSDIAPFISELRRRRQRWQSGDHPVGMARYNRQFDQNDSFLNLRFVAVCAVIIMLTAFAISIPLRKQTDVVTSPTAKSEDVLTTPDGLKETYQRENDKKEQIQYVEQQKMDGILEEQFKKILAQLENNQKIEFPVIPEGNNQATKRKESFLVNSDNILNSLSNDNLEMKACTRDVRIDSSDNIEDYLHPRDSRKFRYQDTLNFDYDELRNTFKFLSDLTSSDIGKFQFGQSAMMLSTLNNNLKQLESLVSNSFEDELSLKIKKQRYRLTNLLIKVIRYGISRAADRLAWHIYDKVKKVERSIKNQWCKFENKIVALDGNTNIPFERCSKRNSNSKETKKEGVEQVWSESLNMKNEYQVDKDSVGKDCNKHSVKEGDEYKNIMKSKEHDKKIKCDTGSNKDQYSNNKNKKYSSPDVKQSKKESPKEQNKKGKKKHKKNSRKNHKDDKIRREIQSEKLNDQFKRQHGLDLNQWKSSFTEGRITENKYVFDKLKSKRTCRHNGKTVECTENFVKESIRKPALQKDSIIEYKVVKECDELTDSNCKKILIDIEKPTDAETEKINLGSDKTIKGIKQWSFVIDESKIGNSSGVSGEWFMKSGQARSKIRNSNQKSDWLFERARGRQTIRRDYYSSAMWVFRRAYARHQCRLSRNLPWCQWQKHTIKTFPANSYFR